MKNKITIGRDELSDIRIDNSLTTVSNRHADICQEGGKLVFCDHSTNGTKINGNMVHGSSHVLTHGDEILLAGSCLLSWAEIDRFFPPRTTKPFNPGDMSDGRTTKPFNPGDVNDGRRTKPFNPGDVSDGRRTKPFNPGDVSDGRRTKPFGQGEDDSKTMVDDVQHRQHTRRDTQQDQYCSQAEIDEACDKWCWGAFLGNWVWAVCHKSYWPAAVVVLCLVPYLGMVCHLALSSYLGLNGMRMAWATGRYKTTQALREAQGKWAVGGAMIFAVSVAVNLMIFYAVMTF